MRQRRRPRRKPHRTAAEQRGDAVRAERKLADVFSSKVVDRLRAETGYNPRQRKATALCLLLIVVQAFLMGQALSFARLRALFIARFGDIRSRAFQLRFKSAAAVAFFRAALAEAVRAVVSEAEVGLDGALASFDDVRVYDGTAVRVPPRGKAAWPASTDDRAGAKLLLGYSIKTGLIEEAEVAAETTGELPLWRKLVPTMKRNVLYLLDLAYFDREIFRHAQEVGAHLLLRLKSKSRIWVVGHQTRHGYVALPRWSLATYLASAPSARGTIYDLDVIWGKGRDALRLRLVGVSLGGRTGRRFYLTTTPRSRLPAKIVADAYRLRWLIGASCEGRMNQSVKVRPGPRDSRPCSWGGAVARKQDGEALRQQTSKGGCATPQVAAQANADVASLHANPVAETVYNARRQQVPHKTSPMRRHPPAGSQRRHGAKVHAETGEALGARRRNLAEEVRPITVSGKWQGWHQGGGSGRCTVDPRAAKRGEGRARSGGHSVRQGEAGVR